MTTFLIWWFIGSIIGVGVNYVLMRDTDNDD
jgi:hypothetical protein